MATSQFSVWSSLLLVGVLLLIPLSLWVLRRFGAIRPGGSSNLAVVESLGIGPRERLIIVRAGERYLLLGSTGQSINLLDRLENYEESTDQVSGFTGVLSEMKRRATASK